MRRSAALLACSLLAVVVAGPARGQEGKVRWRLWRVLDGDQEQSGSSGLKTPDGAWRQRHDLTVAHDGLVEETAWYADTPGREVLAKRSLRFQVPAPPEELVYGQTVELRVTATAACTDWQERYGGVWGAGYHELRSDEAWVTFGSGERAGAPAVLREAHVGGSLPKTPPVLTMSRTYRLRAGFQGSEFRVTAFAHDYTLVTYVYRRVEPGVTFSPVALRRLPAVGPTVDPPPSTPNAEAGPEQPKPLSVSLSLNAFRQARSDRFVAGQVTVRAPEEVEPGRPVTVLVSVLPDRSEEETRALFLSLARTEPARLPSVVETLAIMGRVQRRTLTFDAQRQVTESLATTFATQLPALDPGQPARRCRVVVVAYAGETHQGLAQAPFEVVEKQTGTRFIGLRADAPVAGQPLRLELTCEVQGLAPTAQPPRVSFAGRLLWLGAPRDLWLDGRDDDGKPTKVPPIIPLPDQREMARMVPDDATRARATTTWTVPLRGAGAYTVVLEMAPEGYDLLTHEAPLVAVDARTAPSVGGTQREGGDVVAVSFGALRFEVVAGQARLSAAASLPRGRQLPAGALLTSLNGDALPSLTPDKLKAALAPYRDGSATMGFRLPDGTVETVAVTDE